jgi:hypothetical protein
MAFKCQKNWQYINYEQMFIMCNWMARRFWKQKKNYTGGMLCVAILEEEGGAIVMDVSERED